MEYLIGAIAGIALTLLVNVLRSRPTVGSSRYIRVIDVYQLNRKLSKIVQQLDKEDLSEEDLALIYSDVDLVEVYV